MKRVIWDAPVDVGRWVCARLGTVFDEKTGTALGQTRAGVLVGGVAYDNYRHGSICMHVASLDSGWCSRGFLEAAFWYPFVQLGVRKVIAPINSNNVKARRFVERLGFTLEATIADAERDGDLLIYTMTRPQCRFLGEKHG